MSTTKIMIQAIISEAIEKVWDFYTKPEHITQWNFADPSWHCPKAENDLRVGGKYRSRMEARDGSWGFDFEATYDEVVDKEKFTYTMSDGRQATTQFEKLGNTTKVSIQFDAESENSEEAQKDGWKAILDNFKKYVEAR